MEVTLFSAIVVDVDTKHGKHVQFIRIHQTLATVTEHNSHSTQVLRDDQNPMQA